MSIYMFNAAAQNPSGGLLSILMIVIIFAFMYFMVIRPQKKQDREAAAMRNGLRVGDEITTIGGIIGKIVSIKDPTCIIETGRDGTRIRILKTAVKSVDVPASVTVEALEEKKEEIAEEAENAGKKSKKKK